MRRAASLYMGFAEVLIVRPPFLHAVRLLNVDR